MAGISPEQPPQVGKPLVIGVTATTGAVNQGDDAVNVGVIIENTGTVDGFGHVLGDRGRAVDAGQNADVVPRSHAAAAAHWNTYRHRLAEIIAVSQLAMVNDDFARYWSEICELPITLVTEMVKQAQRQGFCTDDDAHLIAVALVAMLNQFCYIQLSGSGAQTADDTACIATLAAIFHRTIYHEGIRTP